MHQGVEKVVVRTNNHLFNFGISHRTFHACERVGYLKDECRGYCNVKSILW